MPGRNPRNTWMLVAGVVLVLLLAGGLVALDEFSAPVEGVIRIAAAVGYLMVFLAALSSNYMRELTRHFGRAFVKVHHVASIAALVSLLIHSSSVAWRAGSLRVFVPLLSSGQAFLSQGGRPALWLISLAAVVAWLRKKIGKQWKTIHWITYVGFLLGTIHAQMIGRNFEHLGIRIVSATMAVSVVLVFVLKRRAEVLKQQRRRSRM